MSEEIYGKEFYTDDGEICVHSESCNCHQYNALDFAKLLRSKLPDSQQCVADIEDACYIIEQLQAELERYKKTLQTIIKDGVGHTYNTAGIPEDCVICVNAVREAMQALKGE